MLPSVKSWSVVPGLNKCHCPRLVSISQSGVAGGGGGYRVPLLTLAGNHDGLVGCRTTVNWLATVSALVVGLLGGRWSVTSSPCQSAMVKVTSSPCQSARSYSDSFCVLVWPLLLSDLCFWWEDIRGVCFTLIACLYLYMLFLFDLLVCAFYWWLLHSACALQGKKELEGYRNMVFFHDIDFVTVPAVAGVAADFVLWCCTKIAVCRSLHVGGVDYWQSCFACANWFICCRFDWQLLLMRKLEMIAYHSISFLFLFQLRLHSFTALAYSDGPLDAEHFWLTGQSHFVKCPVLTIGWF